MKHPQINELGLDVGIISLIKAISSSLLRAKYAQMDGDNAEELSNLVQVAQYITTLPFQRDYDGIDKHNRRLLDAYATTLVVCSTRIKEIVVQMGTASTDLPPPPSPEIRVLELVRHIDQEFSAGCGIGIDCGNCPLNSATQGSTEQAVCGLLEAMYWCS